MKPIEVDKSNVSQILIRLNANKPMRIINKRAKFKVGDKVRVSKSEQIFEKGYTPNWSTEIFTIDKIKKMVHSRIV